MPLTKSVSLRFRVVLDVLQGWNNLDPNTVLSCYSDNLQYQFLPKTLGRPPMGKETYRDYILKAMRLFREHKIIVNEGVECLDRIILHIDAIGESLIGRKYSAEAILVFSFDGPPDNPKICSVKEFIDISTSAFFIQETKLRRASL